MSHETLLLNTIQTLVPKEIHKKTQKYLPNNHLTVKGAGKSLTTRRLI